MRPTPVTRCPKGHFTNPQTVKLCNTLPCRAHNIGSCRCQSDYHAAANHMVNGRGPKVTRHDEQVRI